MKLGYLYAGKILGNLAPGGVDPYTGEPSEHTFLSDLGKGGAFAHVRPFIFQVDDWHNWDDPSTISGDMYGLWVLVQVGSEPVGSSTLLRLEPNTKGITLDSAIDIPISGVPVGDLNYLMKVGPAPKTAWRIDGTPTNIKGWFRVSVAGLDRWIALYETAP